MKQDPLHSHELTRRSLLKLSTTASIGWMFSRMPAMAGPFSREDFDKLVPADKKLSPEWVKALFAKGSPEVLKGPDLKYVGMPVGGIGAGQLYLGGDGKLWCWDIFNRHVSTGEEHYAKPVNPSSPVAQGFSLKIGDTVVPLDRDGFSEVGFRGEYPIGVVEYADAKVPLAVKLEAYSPFIPLNTEDSSLPATILEFSVRNTTDKPVEAVLTGELENGVCRHNRSRQGTLRQRTVREPGHACIVFSADAESEAADYGTMALALLGTADEASPDGTVPFSGRQTGRLARALRLAPGGSAMVTFIVAWHFPNLTMGGPMKKHGKLGRRYASRFASAEAVAGYIATNHSQLAAQTKLWRDTWYDSTLPWWFLDRTMLNTSVLATSTCYRFADGRFYGWEGVGCCAGTCGHVYHYAHAMGRLFPDLERDMRERVDFGLALQPDGAIHFRGECNDIPAIDSQAGTILRVLREHQMSADDSFLKRNWPKIKLATQWLIGKDADGDGLIEGNQHNTLDSDWFGKVAWLSGLYQAALVAAARMADVIGDVAFASQCRAIAGPAAENLARELFDDGYFINKVDPKRPESINSGTGCHIDQVFGQSWAFQVGLPRVMPEKETVSALKSLWKYNFTPDAGHYRKTYESGRWYAMAGEAGLLMCTFPRNDWDFAQAKGKGRQVFAGYFNECMNGFEYQVAGHMIWEGMVMEGLAITRAVHDRYHASKRNPWNEVECGDHYARSMASYGVYLAACGFEYDGPEGRIGFAPKLTPEDFKCAFTAAEGWGTFRQTLQDGRMVASLSLRRGKLQLKSFVPELVNGLKPTQVKATLDGRPVKADLVLGGLSAEVRIPGGVTLAEGQSLVVELTS